MKTSKIKLLITLGLVLSFIIFPTCKRKQTDELTPFGPSTLSVVLKLSASPNVIGAGANRDSTTITASLQKYNNSPVAGKTVHFEIRDESGNKIYLGHFEGNTSVASRTTNENGEAKIIYHGPLGEELLDTTFVYIFASVSWDGKEFITNLTPIKVVQDAEQIMIELAASPSVLVADTYREISTIKATVMETGGKYLVKEPILFEITDATGAQLNLGYFEGSKAIIEKTTNRNGVARVDYFGPISQEITADTTIYIKAWLPGLAGAPSTSAPISIVREAKDVGIELFAEPNVLVVSSEPCSSILRAYVKKGTMPLPDRRVVFTISSGSGTFTNDKDNIFADTNEFGIATVEYRSPTEDDITADEVVTIQAQVAASGSFVTATAQIQLVRDAADLSLELTAVPNILWVADDNPTSHVSAVFKEGNTPLADEDIFFTITTGSGEFSTGLTSALVRTNSEGIATVTYVGPTKHEITQDETVTITAQASSESSTPVTATVDIELILSTPAFTLELTADPNVLVVTASRPISQITATLKQGNTPIGSRNIIFTLPDGLGQFSNSLQTITATTNSLGIVTLNYFGPTTAELAADQLITVQGQAETTGSEGFITGTVQIQLIVEQ